MCNLCPSLTPPPPHHLPPPLPPIQQDKQTGAKKTRPVPQVFYHSPLKCFGLPFLFFSSHRLVRAFIQTVGDWLVTSEGLVRGW